MQSTRFPRYLCFAFALALGGAGHAATLVVDTVADSVAPDGACSLREAIIASNTNAVAVAGPSECVAGESVVRDRIVFAIPGGAPATILPLMVLPPISGALEIDGYTQPGSNPNTIASLDAYDGVPGIVIDGSQSGPGSKPGLQLDTGASNSIVRGLRITAFTSNACCADNGIAILGAGLSNIEITGNIVHGNQSRGVLVLPPFGVAQNVRIGGPAPADRNLVYAHTGAAGIVVDSCNDCIVRNNWVGLRRGAGTAPAAQGNEGGVTIANAPVGIEIVGNWIAGNTDIGITIVGEVRAATVAGNRIGAGFPNQRGVWIYSLGGSLFPQDNVLQDNLITGNTQQGVMVTSNVAGSQVVRNRLVGNRVFGNGGLEIDLGANGGSFDGVTANDPGDVDQGPNGRQNFPLLQPPGFNGATVAIPYSIDSTAAAYAIELTFSGGCDASGHGPAGQVLSAPVRLEGQAASGTLSFTMPAAPAVGVVSATATGNDGTSEYSACVPYNNPQGDLLFAAGFEP